MYLAPNKLNHHPETPQPRCHMASPASIGRGVEVFAESIEDLESLQGEVAIERKSFVQGELTHDDEAHTVYEAEFAPACGQHGGEARTMFGLAHRVNSDDGQDLL